MMIQEVGVDVAAKRVIWIKARPDFDVLFQLLNNLRVDEQRRIWIVYQEADEDICDFGNELGQIGPKSKSPSRCLTGQALVLQHLDKIRRVRKMMILHLKSEIAQLELIDLAIS